MHFMLTFRKKFDIGTNKTSLDSSQVKGTMRTVTIISALIVLVSVYRNASGLPQTRWGGGGGGGGSGCSKWPCTGGYGGNAS